MLVTCVTQNSVYVTKEKNYQISTNGLSLFNIVLSFKAQIKIHLLRQESLVCIFESSRLVVLFSSTHTDETALYDLNKVVHTFIMHIDGLSKARRIV